MTDDPRSFLFPDDETDDAPHAVSATAHLLDELALSGLLQRARLHPGDGRPPNFRSPASIVMKLMNFRSLDPGYGGKGLSAGSRGDREVWKEFFNNHDRLARTAQAIRYALDLDERAWEPSDEGAYDAEGEEGRILSRLHYERERNRGLVQKKKEQVVKHTGELLCEGCGFSFARAYGLRGIDYIECHHIMPLCELRSDRKTSLDDLALLCSNCHRMVHAKRPWLDLTALREIVVEAGRANLLLRHQAGTTVAGPRAFDECCSPTTRKTQTRNARPGI